MKYSKTLALLISFTILTTHATDQDPNHIKKNLIEPKPASSQKTFCILRSRAGSGVFSIFDDVIDVIVRYHLGEYAGVEIDFDDTGLFYEPAYGKNWWSYCYEPIKLGNPAGAKIEECKYNVEGDWHISHQETLNLLYTDRKSVFNIINQYFHLKDHIQSKIDAFVKAHFTDHFVISVHYRGTDKVKEAPAVAYENVVTEILNVVQKYGDQRYKIFLATDEQAFVDYMVYLFGDQVCYCQDIIRSQDGKPVHFSNSYSRYQCCQEAIIDSILLSRTNVLVRNSSNLSRWSTYFNPEIPVIKLNEQYNGA